MNPKAKNEILDVREVLLAKGDSMTLADCSKWIQLGSLLHINVGNRPSKKERERLNQLRAEYNNTRKAELDPDYTIEEEGF